MVEPNLHNHKGDDPDKSPRVAENQATSHELLRQELLIEGASCASCLNNSKVMAWYRRLMNMKE